MEISDESRNHWEHGAEDIGSGIKIKYTQWCPDRELNPHYEDLPDVKKFGLMVMHTHDDGEFCISGLTFRGPVQEKVSPGRAMWDVISWEPLHIEPSILFSADKGGCGLHGFIREGRWVPA